MLPLATVALGWQLVITVADKVPNLAADQTCRTESKRAPIPNQNLNSCLQSEHTARDKLRSTWGQFTAAQRSQCVSTSTMGGYPSYVELLTCLQMAKEAAQLPDKPIGTTGKNAVTPSSVK